MEENELEYRSRLKNGMIKWGDKKIWSKQMAGYGAKSIAVTF